MESYPRFRGAMLQIREGSYVLLSRPPLLYLTIETFDLHISGTPPTFILSQDQTLKKRAPTYIGVLTRLLRLNYWLDNYKSAISKSTFYKNNHLLSMDCKFYDIIEVLGKSHKSIYSSMFNIFNSRNVDLNFI